MFSVHLSTDIRKFKNDAAVQPKLNIFPTTLMGDRRQSFRPNWYEGFRGPCPPFAALS